MTGSCHCGGVRFKLTPPTEFVSHCHCADCRRTHGAAFVTWTAVPRERFAFLSGEELLTGYWSSDKVCWKFCSRCGSSLLYESREAPHKIYATVGNLDEVDRLPDSHVSFEESPAWLAGSHELPRFKGKTDEAV